MSFGVGFAGSAFASGFAASGAAAGVGVASGLTSAWAGSGGLVTGNFDSDGSGAAAGASLCVGIGVALEAVGATGAASVFGFAVVASPLTSPLTSLLAASGFGVACDVALALV